MSVHVIDPVSRTAESFKRFEDYYDHWLWSHAKTNYARHRPMECFICGDTHVEIHHLHYRTLGRERPDDLVALCEAHHREIERRIAARGWPREHAHHLYGFELGDRGLRRLDPTVALRLAHPAWREAA